MRLRHTHRTAPGIPMPVEPNEAEMDMPDLIGCDTEFRVGPNGEVCVILPVGTMTFSPSSARAFATYLVETADAAEGMKTKWRETK